ncbi:MAG: hypothetical protein KA248_01945 [Kiritimatiellae bacterium]|nr:hypothetical protein [Kiritimatiellia bacterium]
MNMNAGDLLRMQRQAKKLARKANYVVDAAESLLFLLENNLKVPPGSLAPGTSRVDVQMAIRPDGSSAVRINGLRVPALSARLTQLFALLLDNQAVPGVDAGIAHWKSVAVLCEQLADESGEPISLESFNQLAHRLRDWLGAYAHLLERPKGGQRIRFRGLRV